MSQHPSNIPPARSAGKRKAADDADVTGGGSNVKRLKSPAGATTVAASSASASTSLSANPSVNKPKEAVKLRFAITARRGGEADYMDPHEKHFREACDVFKCDDPYMFNPYDSYTDSEGYREAKRDLIDWLAGNIGCDCEDPVAETVKYKTEYDVAIQSLDGAEIGSLKLFVVDFTNAHPEPDEFFKSYENHEDDFAYEKEMRAFAALFTDDDKDYNPRLGHWGPFLDIKVQSAGTKCWEGQEFNVESGPAVHVLELVIKDEWRGQGLGSRVYAGLQRTMKVLRGSKYMFVKLGALERPPVGASITSQAFKDWAERGRRVRAFHRSAGFRRIGNTEFFARAVDPRHPSRAIKPEDDAGYCPPATMPKAQREAAMYAYA